MDRANEFAQIHSGLESLSSDGWQGRAADRFRSKFTVQVRGWADASEAFRGASEAYSSYAGALESAQSQCDGLRWRWEQGRQAVEQAQNNEADARSQVFAGGGIPLCDASCDEGPGWEMMQGAEADFWALVDDVNAAGEALIAALDAGIAKLPERTWWDSTKRTVGSITVGLFDAVKDLSNLMLFGGPGLAEDLGQLWGGKLSPDEFWAKRWDIPRDTISGIASEIATDPGKFFERLFYALTDWDTWSDDPGRAFGRMIPDLVVTIATAGAAAGAKGLTGAARAAYIGREVFMQTTHLADVQDIQRAGEALVARLSKTGTHAAASAAGAATHVPGSLPAPHAHVPAGATGPAMPTGTHVAPAHAAPSASTSAHTAAPASVDPSATSLATHGAGGVVGAGGGAPAASSHGGGAPAASSHGGGAPAASSHGGGAPAGPKVDDVVGERPAAADGVRAKKPTDPDDAEMGSDSSVKRGGPHGGGSRGADMGVAAGETPGAHDGPTALKKNKYFEMLNGGEPAPRADHAPGPAAKEPSVDDVPGANPRASRTGETGEGAQVSGGEGSSAGKDHDAGDGGQGVGGGAAREDTDPEGLPSKEDAAGRPEGGGRPRGGDADSKPDEGAAEPATPAKDTVGGGGGRLAGTDREARPNGEDKASSTGKAHREAVVTHGDGADHPKNDGDEKHAKDNRAESPKPNKGDVDTQPNTHENTTPAKSTKDEANTHKSTEDAPEAKADDADSSGASGAELHEHEGADSKDGSASIEPDDAEPTRHGDKGEVDRAEADRPEAEKPTSDKPHTEDDTEHHDGEEHPRDADDKHPTNGDTDGKSNTDEDAESDTGEADTTPGKDNDGKTRDDSDQHTDGDPQAKDHSANGKADDTADSARHGDKTEADKPTSDKSHKEDDAAHHDGDEHPKDTNDKHTTKTDDADTKSPKDEADTHKSDKDSAEHADADPKAKDHSANGKADDAADSARHGDKTEADKAAPDATEKSSYDKMAEQLGGETTQPAKTTPEGPHTADGYAKVLDNNYEANHAAKATPDAPEKSPNDDMIETLSGDKQPNGGKVAADTSTTHADDATKAEHGSNDASGSGKADADAKHGHDSTERADADPKAKDHSANGNADDTADSARHGDKTEADKPTSDKSHKEDDAAHHDGDEHPKDTNDKHTTKTDDADTKSPKDDADGKSDKEDDADGSGTVQDETDSSAEAVEDQPQINPESLAVFPEDYPTLKYIDSEPLNMRPIDDFPELIEHPERMEPPTTIEELVERSPHRRPEPRWDDHELKDVGLGTQYKTAADITKDPLGQLLHGTHPEMKSTADWTRSRYYDPASGDAVWRTDVDHGAVPGTKKAYTDIKALTKDFGINGLDRTSHVGGSFMAPIIDNVIIPNEFRGTPITSIHEPYRQYDFNVDVLPDGYKAEISIAAPEQGSLGGTPQIQVLRLDREGQWRPMNIAMMLEDNIIKGVTKHVGEPQIPNFEAIKKLFDQNK